MTDDRFTDARATKRRCVRKSSNVPSAVHYVGYVEDDETPESITRKFEELERIQAAAQVASSETPRSVQPLPLQRQGTGTAAAELPGSDADSTLTDAQLMEVRLAAE